MRGKESSILVIDHDQDCRDILRTQLQSRDYMISEADTGERALAILRAEKFDFILLDVNMSDVSSIEILQHIRRDVRTLDTPVIAAGNTADNKQIEDCMRHGANDRLTKPYDILVVKSLLWKYQANSNLKSTPNADAASGTSIAILVVDDNQINLDLVSRRLKGAGYHVNCASNGAQSLRLLNSSNYDLVLLDIMMPDLSGIEVLKLIRSNPKIKNISVIMLSALDDTKSMQECFMLGADDYMTKPFSSSSLTSCIESTLRNKQQSEAAHSQ